MHHAPLLRCRGYILGGLLWFAVPFSLATALGLTALALDLPLSPTEVSAGLVPPAVAYFLVRGCQATDPACTCCHLSRGPWLGQPQVMVHARVYLDRAPLTRLMEMCPPAACLQFGKAGVILITIMVFMAVTSSGSAEFLSVSSIFSYDIYKTYINPKVG